MLQEVLPLCDTMYTADLSVRTDCAQALIAAGIRLFKPPFQSPQPLQLICVLPTGLLDRARSSSRSCSCGPGAIAGAALVFACAPDIL